MPKILCIFGTTGGNTELVIDKISEVLLSKGHTVEAKRAEQSSVKDLEGRNLIILASPTYGHGELQYLFEPFADELKKTDLSGKKFAVIGLGDQRYEKEYLLESAKTLETLVKKQGGQLVCPSLRILNTPVQYLDSSITSWAEKLSAML